MHNESDPRDEQTLWDNDGDQMRAYDDWRHQVAEVPRDVVSELNLLLANEQQPTAQFWRDVYNTLTYGRTVAGVFGSAYANAEYSQMPDVNQLRGYLLETGVEFENPHRTYFMLENMKYRCDEHMKARPWLMVQPQTVAAA